MKKLIVAFFFLPIIISAQEFLKMNVNVDGKINSISYIEKRGMAFVSVKELANLLGCNSFYNNETGKFEFKFNKFKLKFTSRNQFVVVISNSDNKSSVYQLPLSSIAKNDDIFIPLIYSLEYINMTYDGHVDYYPTSNSLAITKPKENDQVVPNQNDKQVDSKYDIYAVEISERANGTLIQIKTSKKITKFTCPINNGVLYLFLTDVTISPDIPEKTKLAGLVKDIRLKNISGGSQLEFVLGEGYSTAEGYRSDSGNELIIAIHNKQINSEILDAEKKNGNLIK